MKDEQEPVSPLVLTADRGAVRVLTLNRPQALNAFTAGLVTALLAALEAAAADASVRCVVLTGAGRAFCAGQDLASAIAAPGEPPKDLQAIVEGYRPLAQRQRSMPVPVVAAVNGVAAGAGLSLALGCDIVLAARSASFALAFSKIGLVPDCGGSWLLPRLVGRARALALAMTGDKVGAEEAQAMGLIWRCLDDFALQDQALALASRLAAMPTAALAATRQAMDAALPMDFFEAFGNEARVQGRLGFAHDYQEGVAAFLAKRTPMFKDR
jgi:2-(1,2-epoxy-1,2-dihydrophenyl)acetyl-CoA isomerase